MERIEGVPAGAGALRHEMCGIAGIVAVERNNQPPLSDLSRMLRQLEHRGPDGEGSAAGEGACLGHRRLAIIDLSESAAQPFPNEDASIWCAVNGEIYNHKALREELESRGHRFRSRCDSEVVVHLYEEKGAELVERLDGMFALAVWDSRRRRLLLARDRMGKKPLYYHETAERIAFSSAIASLLALGSVPNVADELALHHFLTFRFVPSPYTGFRGIRKLPPAHLLVWERGRVVLRRYWSPPEIDAHDGGRGKGPFGGSRPTDSRDAAGRLRSLLAAAVCRRLESDAPLGLLLSGGLDSSAIAVEMARALGGRFDTFSVGFPGTDYDESGWASIVARHVGSRHHPVSVTPEVTTSLPLLVRRFGEPFADSSAVAVETLARAVRPHVKVVLGGDGGDELLGGYDRYRALALSERIGPTLGGLIGRSAAAALGAFPLRVARRNLAGRALRFAEALGGDPLERNESWLTCFTEADKLALYNDDLAGRMTEVDSFSFLRSCYPSSGDASERAMRADLLFTLPDRMLFKLDGATMSSALEARCPFLDTALVEWACRLPSRLKLSGRRSKLIMKAAYSEELPREILARRKAGFGLPVDEWLRGPLRGMALGLIGEGGLGRRDLFRSEPLRALLDEHLSGRRNHDDKLWTLLCLELWFRDFIDTRPAALGDEQASRPPRLAQTPPNGLGADSYLDTDAPRQASEDSPSADPPRQRPAEAKKRRRVG